MYFMVNTTFLNYQEQKDNLTETQYSNSDEQNYFKLTLSISLNASKFDLELLAAPNTLKDFINQYQCKNEIFNLKERPDNTDTNLPNKNFFSNNS